MLVQLTACGGLYQKEAAGCGGGGGGGEGGCGGGKEGGSEHTAVYAP